MRSVRVRCSRGQPVLHRTLLLGLRLHRRLHLPLLILPLILLILLLLPLLHLDSSGAILEFHPLHLRTLLLLLLLQRRIQL